MGCGYEEAHDAAMASIDKRLADRERMIRDLQAHLGEALDSMTDEAQSEDPVWYQQAREAERAPIP